MYVSDLIIEELWGISNCFSILDCLYKKGSVLGKPLEEFGYNWVLEELVGL